MYGLTPREEQIMNTIWNMDHPCLISEILKASPALKRNTVAPALVLLENKGYLKVDWIKRNFSQDGSVFEHIKLTQQSLYLPLMRVYQ